MFLMRHIFRIKRFDIKTIPNQPKVNLKNAMLEIITAYLEITPIINDNGIIKK